MIFAGCTQKSLDVDGGAFVNFKTGLARDAGLSGKGLFLQNSVFEKPLTEIERNTSHDTVDDIYGSGTYGSGKGKGGDCDVEDCDKGKPRVTKSLFPTRKVCSDRGYKMHGFALTDIDPDDLVVKLFPIEGSSEQPFELDIDAEKVIKDIINTGDFSLDLRDVRDGTYNILLCHQDYSCEETDFLRDLDYLPRFEEGLFSDYEEDYERQLDRGKFKFTNKFNGKRHKQYREDIVFEEDGVFGGAPRIVIEKGLVRYPDVSFIAKNRGLRMVKSDINSSKFEAIIAPQIVLLFDANHKDIDKPNLEMATHYGKGEPEVEIDIDVEIEDYEDCDETASPLVIDLANTGVDLSAPLSGSKFDIDADGKLDQVSWPISADSHVLALDLNNDGIVNSGAELFGNYSAGPDGKSSANGFLALAKYDSNYDGRIDNLDDVYSKLILWADTNLDGVNQAEEMSTMAEKGIAFIDLNYSEGFEIDIYGNETRERSTVGLTNGALRMVFDIWFRRISL
jgi:hypothetical protein